MEMRVLLDENLPRKLKWRLEGVEAMTVPERGWNGVSNGKLLRRAAREFDVLLTMDRGMEYHQNLVGIDLGIILLSAPSNDYDDLLPLVSDINKKLKEVQPERVIKVG
jgi:predicted nuclease of predicted toxin-antitoxin system